MALINCPKCGKEISDRGKICPHCKYWIDQQYLAEKQQELLAEGERQYKESNAYKSKIKQEEKMSKLPFCPICGNKENVKRISTLNRSFSVLLWGAASSKIGAQYECTHCKHKW